MTSKSARFGVLLIAVVMLTACGGSGGSGSSRDSVNGPAPPPANTRPLISGTPALTVTRGDSYEFTPTASDPDGDTLTFAVVNQPLWAAFDSATGSLSGTPGEADVGMTSDVTISVSDGDLSASLEPFDLLVVEPTLGSATVSWDIPTTNADGSPLTDLAGFRVHYGTEPGVYTHVVNVDGATINRAGIEGLEPATYFFVVTALDLAGNQSEPSVEVSKVVQP